ncbi:hypothetical protein ACI77O_12020 [Pseudomonas tritici]|uniref:hypothetical protein n=1 Tax=Pseudomonas tritici TaxID=2745518 RepID=UPI00387B5F13
MGAQVKRTLAIQPTEKDNLLLQECLALINSERFNNQLKIKARWEYPSAVEPRDPSEELSLLPPNDQATVAQAMQAYAERDFKTAKDLLEPFCHYELRQINGLYTSAMRHLKMNIWFSTSKIIWRHDPEAIAPAVASIEIKDEVEEILVHPALSSIGHKAPKYVLCYVLFHEGLHKILGTKHYNPHPPLFRRLEGTAQRRDCAVAWLRKHRFSTIEDLA